MYLYLYLFNIYLFLYLQLFYGERAKFNKYAINLAFVIFISLCKYKILWYILQYKCIFIVYSLILYVTVCTRGQFPTPCRVDESVCFSIHALSEGVHSMYQVHAHTFLPKEHDIIRATCGHVCHHMMMFWWCGVFQMMTFTSVLKEFKRKNAWEGGSSKLQFHRVKIHTP